MGAILIVAAMRSEFSGIKRRALELVRLQWPLDCCYGAKLGGRSLWLVANGPGEQLAEEAAMEAHGRERFDAVMSIGYCGALNPDLAAGDIFVATRVRPFARPAVFEARLPATSRRYATGTLITAGKVIQSAAEKGHLRASGGDAVDMEAAAVAGRAAEWGLPFYCVRAVTDEAGEDLTVDLNAARGSDGRFRVSKLLAAALRRPLDGVAQLQHLRERSRLASERLGEFLADCRF